MDPKTKQLVELAEGLAIPEVIGQGDGASQAADCIKALCLAVREQDKRTRHAEEERDLFEKRIETLEGTIGALNERIAEARRADAQSDWVITALRSLLS